MPVIGPSPKIQLKFPILFNDKRRDELLNREIFYTLREAQVFIEQWRVHYNTIRPHSALGYRPPATGIIVPKEELPMNHEAA